MKTPNLWKIPTDCKAWVEFAWWESKCKKPWYVGLGKYYDEKNKKWMSYNCMSCFETRSEARKMVNFVNKSLQTLALHGKIKYPE